MQQTFNFKFFFFFLSINFIFSAFLFDIEFLFFGLFGIMFHLLKGTFSVIHDYIYLNTLKIFFLFLVRIIGLELFCYFFEFLV
uniref:succinate dehydrogenase subunit 4 n=1 Tax=Campylaephora sungminbooi TaxID=1896769 RepID=UPI002E765DE0|nr:succinate dehydrogenase subunit 4 [Campylaephora sungminbooi]WQF69661.1 succinate dehydrogenase subunit 4 [Campylaephora sungminbooi]